MTNAGQAGVWGLIPTALWGLVMLGPTNALSVLGWIFVMLPLWAMHNVGIPGLGSPSEGFFLPSPLGWAVGTVIVWLVWSALILVVLW